MRVKNATLRVLGMLLWLTSGVWCREARATETDGFCSTCELQLGIGGTFHYWAMTHGIVVPVTFNFDDNRYELGAFRMATAQSFYSERFQGTEHNANPYWGFSASRRWELFKRYHWRLVLGLGASYKTEEDALSASHWNFAEQVGVRFVPRRGFAVELTGRHWSNGGLKLPNHGQDFVTLTVSVWPGAWRH